MPDQNEERPDERVWWLAPEDIIPADYKTVAIKSHAVEDPNGTLRFIADGTCPPAMVWMVDLERGGVVVESDLVFPHHPPLDVAIFHLEEESFKRLLGREKGEQDHALTDKGLPNHESPSILGKGFRG